jgi:hypothetical protein
VLPELAALAVLAVPLRLLCQAFWVCWLRLRYWLRWLCWLFWLFWMWWLFWLFGDLCKIYLKAARHSLRTLTDALQLQFPRAPECPVSP